MKKKIVGTILILIVAIMCCACGPETRYKTTNNNSYNNSYEPDKDIEPDHSPMVYITKYGTRYHKFDCSHAKNIYITLTVKQAINKGYSACYYCFY